MRQSFASSTQARSSWPGYLLELGLQPFKKREGVGGGAGEACDHVAVADAADLAGVALDDRLTHANLAVAAMTTCPPLRTVRIVVARHAGGRRSRQSSALILFWRRRSMGRARRARAGDRSRLEPAARAFGQPVIN